MQCKLDTDCAPEQYCRGGWSKDSFSCGDMGPPCTTFLDCQAGEFCDKIKGKCRGWLSTSDYKAMLA